MTHRNRYWTSLAVVLAIATLGCRATGFGNRPESPVYDRLKTHIDGIKVINTHEHQGYWEDYSRESCSFYTHLALSYLSADLVSAGAPAFKPDVIDKGDLDALWNMYGRYLDLCRNTGYYGSFRKGFQVLYDFHEPCFTKDNIAVLSGRIHEKYSNPDQWYARAFDRAGFELMFVDTLDDPFDLDLDPRYFAEVFPVFPVVWSAGERRRLTVDTKPVAKDRIEELLFRYCSVYGRTS